MIRKLLIHFISGQLKDCCIQCILWLAFNDNYLKEAHEHRVMTGAVETGLICYDPCPFVVMMELVITS